MHLTTDKQSNHEVKVAWKKRDQQTSCLVKKKYRGRTQSGQPWSGQNTFNFLIWRSLVLITPCTKSGPKLAIFGKRPIFQFTCHIFQFTGHFWQNPNSIFNSLFRLTTRRNWMDKVSFCFFSSDVEIDLFYSAQCIQKVNKFHFSTKKELSESLYIVVICPRISYAPDKQSNHETQKAWNKVKRPAV